MIKMQGPSNRKRNQDLLKIYSLLDQPFMKLAEFGQIRRDLELMQSWGVKFEIEALFDTDRGFEGLFDDAVKWAGGPGRGVPSSGEAG